MEPLSAETGEVDTAHEGALTFAAGGAGRFSDRLELWRERILGVLLVIAAVLTPIISYAGNLGLAPLAAILGGACVFLLRRRGSPLIGVGILLLLVAWELVSLSWSVAAPLHPDLHRYKAVEALTAVKLVFELALYGALVAGLRDAPELWARRATLILAMGLTALALVMSLDAVTRYSVYQGLRSLFHQRDQWVLARRNASRGCFTLGLLYWPAMIRFGQERRAIWQVVLTLGFLIAGIGLQVDAPLVSLVLGGVAYFAVQRWGRQAIWGIIGAVVVYFALTPVVFNLIFAHGAPLATGGVVKASWLARTSIWRFAAGQVPVHPLIGWGIDASRAFGDAIPLHPHNAALQIWLELGAVGTGIALLFWVWLLDRIASVADRDRRTGGAAAAAAVGYLVTGALSFGVWQEWWLALGALSVVFCIAIGTGRRGAPESGNELIELIPIH